MDNTVWWDDEEELQAAFGPNSTNRLGLGKGTEHQSVQSSLIFYKNVPFWQPTGAIWATNGYFF
jgi:hypothetical protein